ncbi:MAG: hypothetical protein HY724_12075 [Candidatus Rokubacteria bacterium]|nr:hypothetical protein [Candidatus Rokubacteria bacterium]
MSDTAPHDSAGTASPHPIVFRPLQARFLTIPQTPVCYWLRERFFELLAGATLEDVADVCQGLATADDERFVRFVWEVPPGDWARPVRGRRWVPFEKGGGYGKWFGHHFWAVDWEHNGSRIKGTGDAYARNEDRYFTEGWTYTWIARGSLGLRLMSDPAIIAGAASSGIYLREQYPAIAGVLNCRFASAMVRGLSAKIQLPESSVARVPLLDGDLGGLAAFQTSCVAIKRWLVAQASTERTFGRIALPLSAGSLANAYRDTTEQVEAAIAVLHTFEGMCEREVFAAYGIAGEDLEAVLDETGTPAGWFPLIAGYEVIPKLPEGLSIPGELLAPLAKEPRGPLSTEELADLKRRLRAIYEAGPGAKTADGDAKPADEDDEDENEAAVSGARIPIPTETFLEELSQKLEVHPISVHWLLRELRDLPAAPGVSAAQAGKDGVVCQSELQRFVEDYVSVTVLRLLGHRWPREIESGEPLPAWADKDGLIPLTEGTGEATLLERVRSRIAHDFGSERVNAIEREFEEIVGRPLAVWLASELFRRHISQFRKRPVAWQLTSSSAGNDRRYRRGVRRAAPVFSCLVYYHRLDADLLPKLRSQYVGPLRSRFQTELAGLEKLKDRTGDQDARRVELEAQIEELRAFDARLEEAIVRGFDCPVLEALGAKEPLDKWTAGRAGMPAPPDLEGFLAQERRYDPDLNDGVRVNIAPLHRAGILAADVLAIKDIEKAIADRAEWRADERRWCREGKLPRPGWWPERSA